NSMLDLRVGDEVPPETRLALPLLALNSLTMLGAEVMGRSYGGGILKMEPREAASLPVPGRDALTKAWRTLSKQSPNLDAALRRGEWWSVVAEVDRVLLKGALGLNNDEVVAI